MRDRAGERRNGNSGAFGRASEHHGRDCRDEIFAGRRPAATAEARMMALDAVTLVECSLLDGNAGQRGIFAGMARAMVGRRWFCRAGAVPQPPLIASQPDCRNNNQSRVAQICRMMVT
jgi:hypothetical protein